MRSEPCRLDVGRAQLMPYRRESCHFLYYIHSQLCMFFFFFFFSVMLTRNISRYFKKIGVWRGGSSKCQKNSLDISRVSPVLLWLVWPKPVPLGH